MRAAPRRWPRSKPIDSTHRGALTAIRLVPLDEHCEVCRAGVERRSGLDGISSFRNQPQRDLRTGALARGAGLWTVGYAATLDDPPCATVHQAGWWSPEVLRGALALPALAVRPLRDRCDSSTSLDSHR